MEKVYKRKIKTQVIQTSIVGVLTCFTIIGPIFSLLWILSLYLEQKLDEVRIVDNTLYYNRSNWFGLGKKVTNIPISKIESINFKQNKIDKHCGDVLITGSGNFVLNLKQLQDPDEFVQYINSLRN